MGREEEYGHVAARSTTTTDVFHHWEERDGVTERESLVRRGERRRRLHEWGMGGVLGWVYVAAVLGRGGRAYDEDGRQIRSDDRLCPDNLGRSDCA